LSTEDTAKHSFGPEWEDDSREVLSEVDFDTDLGIELARDAQRLSQGKISEDEFYSRHNEKVREEFGIDARPTDPTSSEPLDEETVNAALDDEVVAEPVPTPHENGGAIGGDGGGDGPGGNGPGGDDEDDGFSRRSVLKSVGAVAAGIAAGTWSNRSNPGGLWDDDEEQVAPAGPGTKNERKQMGFVIDVDACIGGAHCAQACDYENQTPNGALWQFVFQYEESDRDEAEYLIRPCQHCSNPPCVSVCPVRARHKREDDGIVLTDYDICIGCRYCQVACPYGVNYFQWGEPDQEKVDTFRENNADLPALDNEDRVDDPKYDKEGRHTAGPQHEKGIMGKCVFCVHRQDSGDPELEGTTACYEACPVDAIHVGDLNDPESKPRKYLDQVQTRHSEDGSEKGQPEAGYDTTSEDSEWQRQRHVPRWRFQEEYGTRPNVIYVGNQPSEDANDQWVDKPGDYESYGLHKKRDGFDLSHGHGGEEGDH
jgi:Fe-S-cluster-containing dehydrogenase component